MFYNSLSHYTDIHYTYIEKAKWSKEQCAPHVAITLYGTSFSSYGRAGICVCDPLPAWWLL